MNYELAKKLKDAGFPQKSNFRIVGVNEKNPEEDWPAYPYWPGAVSFPTLSELIEACGHNIQEIYRADKSGKSIWVAKCCDVASHNGEGSTPEEAVANLWLALNN